MKKMMNKKGFTMAELLIVVAIIAVLVAIAIPVFTSQLNKSTYAKDVANARSLYAELQADYLSNSGKAQSDLITSPASLTDITNTDIKTSIGGTSNAYSISDKAKVTVTLGTAAAAPTVEVEPSVASATYGVKETFGK